MRSEVKDIQLEVGFSFTPRFQITTYEIRTVEFTNGFP